MINDILGAITIFFIRIYQATLSPDKGIPRFWLKGKVCRHEPHCSQYAAEHIKKYGFYKSILPIMDRISNCTAGYTKINDPVQYKIVFFSSAAIGIPFLEKLNHHKKFEISGVVTQPDQPSGRGMQIKQNIIKTTAQNMDIKQIITPNTLKLQSKKYHEESENIQKRLQEIDPDFLVVIAYGKLIPQHILDIPKIDSINIHGSLLPYYRGASPIQSALLNGEHETGITIMKMSAGLDEGDILSQLKIPLKCSTTSQDLINQFGKEGPDFLCDTILQYAKKHITSQPQDHTKATYTSKITKLDGEISLTKTPFSQVLKKYNAYFMRPKISFLYNNKRHIIQEIQVDCTKLHAENDQPLLDNNNNLHPSITNITITPENKKTITRDEWKQGYLKSY